MLSIDAGEDAEHDFQAVVSAGPAEPEAARLSAAIVLSQILLLEGKYDQYADLATVTVAPLLLKLRRPLRPAQASSSAQDLNRLLPDIVGALALLPLTSQTFLSELTRDRLVSAAKRREALRDEAKDDHAHFAVDLVLEACYRQLGQEPKRREAEVRIKHSPALAAAPSDARIERNGE